MASKKSKKRCRSSKNPKASPGDNIPAPPSLGVADTAPLDFSFMSSSLPGQRFFVTMVPQFDNQKLSHADNPKGGPGDYRVIFALHRPGSSLDSAPHFMSPEILTGNSYLKMKGDATVTAHIFYSSDTASLRAAVKRNSHNFMAKIETDPFLAKDFADARQIAFRMMAPMLSYWSIETNSQLSIYRTDVIELATESRLMDIVAPFPELDFTLPNIPISLKLRGYSSLYRESLNSNSPAYSFICLYRIIEGLEKDRKKRVIESKAQAVGPPNSGTWLIPATESQYIAWLNALYRIRPPWNINHLQNLFPEQIRGKRLSKALEHLRELRNKIAHAIFGEDGCDFWEESFEYMDHIEMWTPLAQMIVRRMLKDNFPSEFLVGVPDVGLEELFKRGS